MKKILYILLFMFSITLNAEVKSDSIVNPNITLDDVLQKTIQKAIVIAEKTGDFVIKESPLVLQEFYNWHIAENVLFILLAIMLFLCGRYIPYLWLHSENQGVNSKQFFNKYSEDSYSSGDFAGALMMFIILTIISAVTFITSLYDLIKLIVSPKLYLIEYFIK